MTTLHYGDNLDVMREYIKDESVDLIYLDPPFNSQASYNVLFKTPAGDASAAQAEAFRDTWTWGKSAEEAYSDVLARGGATAAMLRALRSWLAESDMMAYLTMMAARLEEMHRSLKPTGSLYLHCDPTASHYLKVMLDGVFGAGHCRNEIIWKRTNARGTTGKWPRVHDTLLFYTKSGKFTFQPQYRQGDLRKIPHTLITGSDGRKYQTYEMTAPGTTKEGQSGQPWHGRNPGSMNRHWANSHEQMEAWDALGLIHWPKNGGWPRRLADKPFRPEARTVTVDDVWLDIDRLNQTAKERQGYPTQKPLALLDRIIAASSKKDDLILDPFCGCGTTVHAAQRAGRRWIGIDVTHHAIALIETRLEEHFPALAGKLDIQGRPTAPEEARHLAERSKYQFQWWANWKVGVQLYNERKKGPDRGIDGTVYFGNPGHSADGFGRVIVSVKGGENVSVAAVRELAGTVQREAAQIGLLVTARKPTPAMLKEATAAGFAATGQGRFPKLQIVDVDDLFGGPLNLPRPYRLHDAAVGKPSRPAKPTKKVDPRQRHLPLPVSGGLVGGLAEGTTMDPRFRLELATISSAVGS